MSQTMLRRCPVFGCKYNHKLVYADKSQIKNHISRDHDYQEKLEAAAMMGIIRDVSEHRSPSWLADSLVEFSLVGGI
ncbi:MAG TPA: hypothetical protein VNL34_04935 [Candidatus Nitrosotenuis sp.]|nr:hypothetical protein [Candidatus Nitrosotenuis sp.]